jgi:hypothetical protein
MIHLKQIIQSFSSFFIFLLLLNQSITLPDKDIITVPKWNYRVQSQIHKSNNQIHKSRFGLIRDKNSQLALQAKVGIKEANYLPLPLNSTKTT